MLFSGTFRWVTPECHASINLGLIYFSVHIPFLGDTEVISIYIYTYFHIPVCQISMSFWPEKHTKSFSNALRESSSVLVF